MKQTTTRDKMPQTEAEARKWLGRPCLNEVLATFPQLDPDAEAWIDEIQ